MTTTEQIALLSTSERAERANILATGGALAATMRTAEAVAWPDGMLAEVWVWAAWIVMVRSYRGATTGAKYVRAVAAFAAWLQSLEESIDWREVNLDQLEGWLKHLFVQRRHGKSHRSVAVSAVKSFYRFRAARGRGRDCSYGLIGPKVDRRMPRRHSPAELRAIFACLGKARTPLMALRDRALLLLLLSSGIRREEVSMLTVDAITIEGRIAVVRIFGKGAKEREVALEGPVVSALVEWLDKRRQLAAIEHPRVFVTFHAQTVYGPLSPGGVERIVKKYARTAGVRRYGVHVFRVTFATQLYDDGADIERIRIVMGHESIETTRGYIAVSNRQRSVRLKPHRQHAALGSVPDGMPRWAKHLEEHGHG